MKIKCETTILLPKGLSAFIGEEDGMLHLRSGGLSPDVLEKHIRLLDELGNAIVQRAAQEDAGFIK